MDEIYHYVAKLPNGVSEVVMPCYDGYTIYTADRLGTFEAKEAYRHALKHITRVDFEKTDVQQIERDVRE